MKIFVFGSNLSGRHGKGAALFAKQNHGAIQGRVEGIQGHSYGIPTKNYSMQSLPHTEINRYVEVFLMFARAHPEHTFTVTRIGCGLAGYRDKQISPMFSDAPPNCELPEGWR